MSCRDIGPAADMHVLCRVSMAETEIVAETAPEISQSNRRESSSTASTGLLVNDDDRISENRGTITTRNGYLAPPPRLLISPPLLPCSDQDVPRTPIIEGAGTSVETLGPSKLPSIPEADLPAIEGGWI